jgi:thiol-disulfide isomerase/thioredoxin
MYKLDKKIYYFFTMKKKEDFKRYFYYNNMSAIKELHADHFKKMKGNRGFVLGIANAQNLTLVMFYSIQCTYCDQAMPELEKLAHFIQENNLPITVAVCDIMKHKSIIKESADTVDPIKFVPYMPIYLGEKPYLRYNGKKTAEEMLNYLIEILKRVDTRQKFVSHRKNEEEEEEKAGPEGVPYNVVCEGDVCYVTQDEIFGAPKKKFCVGNVCYLTQEEMFSSQGQ